MQISTTDSAVCSWMKEGESVSEERDECVFDSWALKTNERERE